MLGNTRFFVGQVEDNDDSHISENHHGQGRVQVRVFGIHNPEVPQVDLPWALCIMPNNYGGVANKGTVPPPQLQKGAWVLGISVDETYNNLIVLGCIVMPENMADLANAGQFGGTDSMLGPQGNYNPVFSSNNCDEALMNANNRVESSVDWANLTDAQNARASERGYQGAGQIGDICARHWYNLAQKGKVPGGEAWAKMSYQDFYNQLGTSAALNKAVTYTIVTHNLKQFGGNPYLAIAAHNQGVGGTRKFVNWAYNNKGVNVQTMSDGTQIGNLFREWMTSGGGINAASNKEHMAKLDKIFQADAKMQDCLKQWAQGNAPFKGGNLASASAMQWGPNMNGTDRSNALAQDYLNSLGNTQLTEKQAEALFGKELPDGAWCAAWQYNMFEKAGLSGVLPETNAVAGLKDYYSKNGRLIPGNQVNAGNIAAWDTVIWKDGNSSHTGTVMKVEANPSNPNNPYVTVMEGNWGGSRGTSRTFTTRKTLSEWKNETTRGHTGFSIGKNADKVAQILEKK